MRSIIAAMILTCLGATVSHAQAINLGRPEASRVFVWKDRESQKAATAFLRDNGVNGDTWAIVKEHFLACMTAKGTPAVILKRVSASYEILITAGPCAGQTGVIQEEDANG